MSKGVIFQELRVVGGDIIQLIPFVCAFYAFEFPMFYNHHNREDDVTIILFTMGIHQGDPWGVGALFILAHFMVLHSIINPIFPLTPPSFKCLICFNHFRDLHSIISLLFPLTPLSFKCLDAFWFQDLLITQKEL
jgi:hypothetical protein